ncbi:MAG: dTDP-4-amino-4,6-dideoxygalactose transaminase [Planctomycetota bacterium]|jgi:dTDP-4-amino-4,6-dideoxygalactose transaminase
MKSFDIPFNKPCFEGKELVYIAKAIDNGLISGDGSFTKRCHTFFEEHLGVYKAFLTTSCTHALEMAAILLDIKEGDEVIVPSFTFVSTVNAFVLRRAKPVFVDIRPDTLNMDENQIEKLITPRIRAILPVHYAGIGCEMNRIMELAQKCNIEVIEDNAHGLLGKYKGKFLGTFGGMSALSFHETKNFTCGEGGALLINNPVYAKRAEIIREKGTNRSQLFRGEVDKYSWVDIGSSYLPSDMLAAFLSAQERDHIQKHRAGVWNNYYDSLSDWAASKGVKLPTIPEHCQQSYHMFYMIMPTNKDRDALIAHLKERGILSVFHYLPLHLSKMGMRLGGYVGQCPETEDISERLVRLPFYNSLSETEQAIVIEAIIDFYG